MQLPDTHRLETGGATVRRAGTNDAPALTALIEESGRHYWGDGPGIAARAQAIAAALLDGTSGCRAALVFADGRARGYVTYTLLHDAPTPAGVLYLKDIYVTASARGGRLGAVLMQWLAQLAVAQGCTRFDWTAEDDNPRALAFYDRLPAARVTQKVYFRLEADRLRAMAETGGTET